ncbi:MULTISPECIES: hypothetical protein [Laspinema]|nr:MULTISPECIES: hypothetical protein [unclassified Laspinema]MCT7985000.1 hypothetical protein [Laspinema sp. D2d]MCT7996234.1 hypothetical protein [Laspinema sp. D3c]
MAFSLGAIAYDIAPLTAQSASRLIAYQRGPISPMLHRSAVSLRVS